MKRFHLCLILTIVCSLFMLSAPVTAHITPTSASAQSANNIPVAAWIQLLRALIATARYNNVATAVADGYVNTDTESEPGEGFHFVKFSLVDCTFNPEHPEVLLYARQGNHLRLVGVEYVEPLPCSATAPEGFTGHADVWRQNSEGAGLWELNAWIWLPNPNGVFAPPPHPGIP